RYFEVDALAPVITIISPPTEFHGGDVWLNISLDKRVSWCGYSIDGAADVTMSNTTLTNYNKLVFGLSKGTHTVTFYCNNTYGLMSSTLKEFNNTEGFVVIKLIGTGFTSQQNINNKYISIPFADGTTTGIIHADGIYESMSSSTTHIELRQKTLIPGNTSKAYIVYTKGDTDTIENRISKITNGNINHMSNPSFAYSINKKYNIQVGLEYIDIDINRSLKLPIGFYNIRLKHNGLRNDKIIMDITRAY
ncbi:hypothetical protein GQ473_01990, partial [archaeon]|nr:hypothetical protein [archaeon]